MDFQNEPKINYDPHHVISLRKQANKNKPFDHQSIEGLAEKANWLQFTEISKFDEDAHTVPVTSSQIAEGTSIMIKRSLSEIKSMEIDEDGSHKKAKLLQGGEVLNAEISDGLKKVSLIPVKAVQVNQFSFKGMDGSELSPIFKSKE